MFRGIVQNDEFVPTYREECVCSAVAVAEFDFADSIGVCLNHCAHLAAAQVQWFSTLEVRRLNVFEQGHYVVDIRRACHGLYYIASGQAGKILAIYDDPCG